MSTPSEEEPTKEKCIENIHSLFDKYNDNVYMMQRLQYHLLNILPSTLENEDKNHVKRQERANFLSNEQKIFIQVFLSKNRYYYLTNNNCFYHYNGKSFSSVREDDIQHQLLSNISKDRTLMQWKYKTKINIIKQIKERNLFQCVPEPETIQNVIRNLYPVLFKSKNEAKYFLTIIGDNILKKNNDLIFLIKPTIKKILVELDNIVYITSGFTNPTFNFMTKYHETYSFEKCRILNINDMIDIDIWKSILKKIGLDLLCVAVHYSNRCDSDAFISNHVDEEFKNYTLYLKNNSQKAVLDKFCASCIQKIDYTSSTPISINWKNMHYLWKNYISGCSLPNMIYSHQLKTILKDRYKYDETTDSFLNVISKYLPNVSNFLLFWEKTIQISDMSQETEVEEIENEFEIDELCSLFKKWVSQQQTSEVLSKNGNVNERDVIKIIKHFYPNVEIEDNKYVLNISCTMWNKVSDVNEYLQMFQIYCNENRKKGTDDSLISFDEIYDFYCEKIKPTNCFVVNKRFFEKYLFFKLNGFIEYEKFVNPIWYYSE
jgi:hypothetical protein|uniref:Uncharacterized protein n=1 Tax=viral metagenome TaxID=1070528 RepID=A0A6C0CUY0_9ZZZZ